MINQNRFDIIIAGAGAAGLSLLWQILNSPQLQDQSILLIDQSFEPINDKTWCFWEDFELPDGDLFHHSWNHLLVKIGGETYSAELKSYEYKCLRSNDFSEFILKIARNNNQVTFLNANVKNFNCTDEYGCVYTSEGNFESGKIFQSVLKPPGFDRLKVDISLIQHFLGWEINSGQNLFDPNIATFMDFDVPQKDGLSFIYLLPFSKTRALVEYTIFSKNLLDKDQYRDQVKRYLSENYGLKKDNYSIHREETGAIPMEDRRYPTQFCDFVWNIGTVGGFAKPSTGYTFSRIQKHTMKIIKALENGVQMPQSPPSSYRFRVYDLMMLYLLEYEKKNALRSFEYLFKKNKLDDVLQFLSEESNFAEELSIFLRMPYKPFLRSIYYMKHRILSGV